MAYSLRVIYDPANFCVRRDILARNGGPAIPWGDFFRVEAAGGDRDEIKSWKPAARSRVRNFQLRIRREFKKGGPRLIRG